MSALLALHRNGGHINSFVSGLFLFYNKSRRPYFF